MYLHAKQNTMDLKLLGQYEAALDMCDQKL